MITADPTTATSNGDEPSRIAGSTNSTSTAKLTTSPPSAASPRSRPAASTTTTNNNPSSSSGRPRWKSMTWYCDPGGASGP
jgi:hypothetical protein